jgi:sulfate-transporting ATPase
LEEAILNYAGCMVVISHDHWFLDRIAEGSFQTYEEQRKSRLGIAADQPHRFR